MFPSGLPMSMRGTTFRFASKRFPLCHCVAPSARVLGQNVSVTVPSRTDRVHSVHLAASLDRFACCCPRGKCGVTRNVRLPPFQIPTIKSLCTGNIVVRTKTSSPNRRVRPSVTPCGNSMVRVQRRALSCFSTLVCYRSVSRKALSG